MTLRVSELSPGDWSAVAADFADLTFEQTREYSEPAARRIGARVRYLVIHENGRPVASVALRVKTLPGLGLGIAWCPSGPLVMLQGKVLPDAAALQAILTALRQYLCDRQGYVLRFRLSGVALLDPAVAQAGAVAAGFSPYAGRPPYRSFALDLSQDPDTLMRRLNGKWRTDLRFALKSDLGLDRGFDAALQARFLALYAEVQAAKGFQPEITPEFHFGLFTPGAENPDYALDVLIATKDGVDVAGIVVGTAGPTATYLFGATGDAGRPLRAGYFLTWNAILLAQGRGQRWYDLGGVDFDANPDVARFKERMGGERIEADVYEARPKGLVGKLIIGLETLRAQLRRR